MDMQTFGTVISELGGPSEVGRAIGAKPDTVRKMAGRGRVQAEYWPALVKLARDKRVAGITHASLALLAAAKPRKQRKPARKAA